MKDRMRRLDPEGGTANRLKVGDATPMVWSTPSGGLPTADQASAVVMVTRSGNKKPAPLPPPQCTSDRGADERIPRNLEPCHGTDLGQQQIEAGPTSGRGAKRKKMIGGCWPIRRGAREKIQPMAKIRSVGVGGALTNGNSESGRVEGSGVQSGENLAVVERSATRAGQDCERHNEESQPIQDKEGHPDLEKLLESFRQLLLRRKTAKRQAPPIPNAAPSTVQTSAKSDPDEDRASLPVAVPATPPVEEDVRRSSTPLAASPSSTFAITSMPPFVVINGDESIRFPAPPAPALDLLPAVIPALSLLAGGIVYDAAGVDDDDDAYRASPELIRIPTPDYNDAPNLYVEPSGGDVNAASLHEVEVHPWNPDQAADHVTGAFPETAEYPSLRVQDSWQDPEDAVAPNGRLVSPLAAALGVREAAVLSNVVTVDEESSVLDVLGVSDGGEAKRRSILTSELLADARRKLRKPTPVSAPERVFSTEQFLQELRQTIRAREMRRRRGTFTSKQDENNTGGQTLESNAETAPEQAEVENRNGSTDFPGSAGVPPKRETGVGRRDPAARDPEDEVALWTPDKDWSDDDDAGVPLSGTYTSRADDYYRPNWRQLGADELRIFNRNARSPSARRYQTNDVRNSGGNVAKPRRKSANHVIGRPVDDSGLPLGGIRTRKKLSLPNIDRQSPFSGALPFPVGPVRALLNLALGSPLRPPGRVPDGVGDPSCFVHVVADGALSRSARRASVSPESAVTRASRRRRRLSDVTSRPVMTSAAGAGALCVPLHAPAKGRRSSQIPIRDFDPYDQRCTQMDSPVMFQRPALRDVIRASDPSAWLTPSSKQCRMY